MAYDTSPYTRRGFAIRLALCLFTGPIVAFVGSVLDSQFRRSHR